MDESSEYKERSIAGSVANVSPDKRTGRHSWESLLRRTNRLPAIYLTVIALCLLLVFPSAFLNRLFTFDLGGIFGLVTGFPADFHSIVSPYNAAGRYFPLYWLYHVALFRTFSWSLPLYFVVQSVIVLASALIICYLYIRLAGPGIIAILFAISLLIGSPNVEVIYTLGKAEPLLCLFVFLLLLGSYSLLTDKPRLLILKLCGIAISFACALWFKETAEVALVFAITGMAVCVADALRNSWPPRAKSLLRGYSAIVLSLVIGLCIAKSPYLIFRRDAAHSGSTYTTYSITPKLVFSNVVFYVAQQPDVIFWGLLATVMLWIIGRRLDPLARSADTKMSSDYIFALSLLAMAWSYVGGLLIWRWGMAYYLFIPAIVFKAVSAYGVYIGQRERLWGRRRWMLLAVGVSSVSIYTVIYLCYAGASQAAYSQMYSKVLDRYLSASHDGDALIFESYPFYSEQVTNTSELFKYMFHVKRKVVGIADMVDPAVVTPEMRQLLRVSDSALAGNQVNWPKKGDYLIDFPGNLPATWQVRGVSPWLNYGSTLRRDGGYDMTIVGRERIYFPALFFNVLTGWPNLSELFTGYELFRVTEGPRFTWIGRYPDGWIGRTASLTIYAEYAHRAKVSFSTAPYNSPNHIAIYRGNTLVAQSELTAGREYAFTLEANPDEEHTAFRFEVTRVFVPKSLRMNKDARELGALVRVDSITRE